MKVTSKPPTSVRSHQASFRDPGETATREPAPEADGDDQRDGAVEATDRRGVEVVGVGVGDQHPVDLWQVSHLEPRRHVAGDEAPDTAREVGVDQESRAVEAAEERRVADPGQPWLAGGPGGISFQVGRDPRRAGARWRLLSFAGQAIEDAPAQGFSQAVRWMVRIELGIGLQLSFLPNRPLNALPSSFSTRLRAYFCPTCLRKAVLRATFEPSAVPVTSIGRLTRPSSSARTSSTSVGISLIRSPSGGVSTESSISRGPSKSTQPPRVRDTGPAVSLVGSRWIRWLRMSKVRGKAS